LNYENISIRPSRKQPEKWVVVMDTEASLQFLTRFENPKVTGKWYFSPSKPHYFESFQAAENAKADWEVNGWNR
jgi:hypothetical protein